MILFCVFFCFSCCLFLFSSVFVILIDASLTFTCKYDLFHFFRLQTNIAYMHPFPSGTFSDFDGYFDLHSTFSSFSPKDFQCVDKMKLLYLNCQHMYKTLYQHPHSLRHNATQRMKDQRIRNETQQIKQKKNAVKRINCFF